MTDPSWSLVIIEHIRKSQDSACGIMGLINGSMIHTINYNFNLVLQANNMYNDIWRRTQTLEGLAKDTMSLSNATRREVQDGLRTLALQIGRRGLFQSDRDRQEGTLQ